MDWTSYDSAAASHDSLRVPKLFRAPARDLAARMEFGAARSALDVGTGSGVVAAEALAAGCAAVAGVDPSLEMVRIARRNGIARVAVAAAPGLPFGDESFDRVTAGFVLSHVVELRPALADMARVTRRGGRIGVTSWNACRSEHHDVWDALLEQFGDRTALGAAHDRALPWHGRLSRADGVRDELGSTGLREIAVEEIEYPIRMTVAEFLAMRDTSFAARFLRASAGDAVWRQFREAATDEFARRFRDSVEYTRAALIATGRR